MILGPDKLWLIPLLPLIAAAILSVFSSRLIAGICSISAMALSFILSLLAFAGTLQNRENQIWNFDWLQFGNSKLQLGFLLNPLTASMLVMVTFVGMLIFIYSTGYMAQDKNYTKFFCFMSLFAAGMLGVVTANSLLLLFICWEIVGLASYLLIGFWFFKPSAALAARKAFITTRIGDVGLFLGMIWLYSSTGTLLFYDHGNGCLENAALSKIVAQSTMVGISVATGIALLIFCGAVGKSGQFPLHVWLPDAMEGPTPVSALIHAATMVAAGVFLVARTYPLMDVDVAGINHSSAALTVITWTGAITAIFAASIAVAQNDIKRILAYSTVSQLGYMMLGLGAGGVFVGMFHLITHAFFKALLFLGAGSVIHGTHEEQDITKMGALKAAMPVTFATYAIGMMALSGVPLIFSGFWSKDEILHAAAGWGVSKIPFLLALAGAFLTAFYMTRQVVFIFFGKSRLHEKAHESPRVMTMPLIVLAICAVLLGFIGTPLWPWFEHYLEPAGVEVGKGGFNFELMGLMILSSLIVLGAIFLGWRIYGRAASGTESASDPLALKSPQVFTALRERLYIDELYETSVIRGTKAISAGVNKTETGFFSLVGHVTGLITIAFGWLSRVFDRFVIDFGFDQSCRGLEEGAGLGGRAQGGNIQTYIRTIAVTLAVVIILLVWGLKGG
jgi:NADH-quinone oxidoreductase subunit L